MKRFISYIAASILMLAAHAEVFEPYPYWDMRQSLFATLPVDSTDIIFLGNSLTDGGKWGEMFGMKNVKNRGISSDVVGGVAQRTECITSGKPAKIFLLIGVNDLSHHHTPDSIVTAVGELVKKIQRESPTTQIYLQSYLPINNDFGVYKRLKNENENLMKCHLLLRKLAQDMQLPWIDLFTPLMDKDCKLRAELTADGLHLNEDGYRIWRNAVAPYVNPELSLTEEVYPVPQGSVVLVGNTLRARGEWHELLNSGAVKSRGTWIDTTKDLPLLSKIMAGYKPEKMFIQSTYNTRGDNKVNIGGNFSADSIVAAVKSAIIEVKSISPSTKIYIESLVPVNPTFEKYASFAGKAKAIKAANKKLQQLAKKMGVTYVDITTPLSDSEGYLRKEYTNDGFVLLGSGYQAWAGALKPYIE